MVDMDMNTTMTINVIMPYTFYSNHDFKLYFDSWHVDNDTKYQGAIAALFFASIGLELLCFLCKLALIFRKRIPKTLIMLAVFYLGYGCLYFLWAGLAYLLMLAVMTYSTGVFCAITTGLTLGHVAFRMIEMYTPFINKSMDQTLPIKNPCC